MVGINFHQKGKRRSQEFSSIAATTIEAESQGKEKLMKVTMFWHGGSSYACFSVHEPKDADVFDSLANAKRDFANRVHDPYTPCVSEDLPENGGPEAWLFFGKAHPVIGQEYPDAILSFGPRRGVRMERTG